MAKYDFVTNEHVPQGGNRFTKWLGASILNIMGWKITGAFPNEPKAVFIGVPHTSNWDMIIAVASMQAVGLKASWMMKKEASFGLWAGFSKNWAVCPLTEKPKPI